VEVHYGRGRESASGKHAGPLAPAFGAAACRWAAARESIRVHSEEDNKVKDPVVREQPDARTTVQNEVDKGSVDASGERLIFEETRDAAGIAAMREDQRTSCGATLAFGASEASRRLVFPADDRVKVIEDTDCLKLLNATGRSAPGQRRPQRVR